VLDGGWVERLLRNYRMFLPPRGRRYVPRGGSAMGAQQRVAMRLFRDWPETQEARTRPLAGLASDLSVRTETHGEPKNESLPGPWIGDQQ